MALKNLLSDLILPRKNQLELLSLVATQTSNAVIITDKDGMVQWVNKGFETLTGYELEEVKGRKPGSFLQGPDTDPQTVEEIRQGLASKGPFQVEILNYTKAHKPYWLELNINPVFNDQDEIEHYIAIELDITERRQLQEEMQQKNEELNSLLEELNANNDALSEAQRSLEGEKINLENANKALEEQKNRLEQLSLVARETTNAVIISNPEGKIEWVNEGFYRITGYELDEVKGKKPGHFLQGPQTNPETVEEIRKSLEKKEPFRVEILNYTKQHKPYWLELHITPILDDEGSVRNYIAIETDITDRKYQEEEMQQLLEEVRMKNEELQTSEEELRQNMEEIQTLNERLSHQNEALEARDRENRYLRMVAQETDNAVIVTDRNGSIEWVNGGFKRITGYSFDEVKGKKPGSFLQGEATDPETVQRIRKQLKENEPFVEEILNYTKQGKEYWLELRITPVLNDEGEVDKYVALETDITERKLAEEELKSENKDIMDSIHYARRIQNAILPSPRQLQNRLPGFFLIYAPRDIVSGDYYWYRQVDGYDYIAVVDCTGHGVPGSLMSMLGHTLLNQVVDGEGLRGPAEILAALDRGVRENLSQNDRKRQMQDGMDLGLVRINPETQEAVYAGANRPLWIQRGEEIETVKPTRRSIGFQVIHTVDETPFEEVPLELSAEDRLFLFSDGITDQFGGEKGRKFSAKRLREVILENCADGLQEQRRGIHQALTQWRGEGQQTDDITLIGFHPFPSADSNKMQPDGQQKRELETA